MQAAFTHSLGDSLASLNLNADIIHEFESNVAKLGDLYASPGVDPEIAETIRAGVAQAFVFGFRVIMLICAILAGAAAAVAYRKIPATR